MELRKSLMRQRGSQVPRVFSMSYQTGRWAINMLGAIAHHAISAGSKLLLLVGMLLGIMVSTPVPAAQALIHHYPDGADRMMVRSLQTLRDSQNQAWQLVLFKWVRHGQVEALHLRLVGFPGGDALAHPQSLTVALPGGDTLEADDVFPQTRLEPELADTIGEYDLQWVMQSVAATVPSNASLTLLLPLQYGDRELLVPPFAVREWRQLLDAL